MKNTLLYLIFLFIHLNSFSQRLILESGESITIKESQRFFDYVIMKDKSRIFIDPELRDVKIFMGRAEIGNDCQIVQIRTDGKRIMEPPTKKGPASKCGNGIDGLKGNKGENGKDGCNITLDIGIVQICKLVFISPGGNGGIGSIGQEGQDAGDCDCSNSAKANGGNGGPGGDGGDGGNGGIITVKYSHLTFHPTTDFKCEDNIESAFILDSPGGSGEQGGEGGKGGRGSRPYECIGYQIGGGKNGDKNPTIGSTGKEGITRKEINFIKN